MWFVVCGWIQILKCGQRLTKKLFSVNGGPFAVFRDKHLRSNGCNSISFTAVVNCANPKIEIQSEIIEIQIIEMEVRQNHQKTDIFSLLAKNLFVRS